MLKKLAIILDIQPKVFLKRHISDWESLVLFKSNEH